MSLDGVLGQEQGLRDLSVGHRSGRHAGHAQLGGGEVAAALGGISAGSRTGCDELVVGSHGNGVGTAGAGQLERLAEWLARLGAPAGASGRRPQFEQCDRVLESPRRLLELGDGSLEQLDAGVSLLDDAKRAQRNA